MAKRRMVSLEIIDTDKFLEMPQTAQNLYFHLLCRGDDDGFVGNPKKIARVLGSSDDDMRILLAKNYLIPFETGVCVIKDWKIHNYIQKDRYKETLYKQEKSMIQEDVNNSYFLKPVQEVCPVCIQDVSKMDTQVRLGKSKDSIELELELEENNSLSEDKSSEPIPEKTPKGIGLKEVKEFVDLYNSIAVRLPKVQKISSNREKKIKARLKNIDLNGWKKVFERCEKSDFCCGVNKNNWTASLDWLISNDNNYVKVLEGRYDNKFDMRSGRNSIEDDKLSELQRKGMEIL